MYFVRDYWRRPSVLAVGIIFFQAAAGGSRGHVTLGEIPESLIHGCALIIEPGALGLNYPGGDLLSFLLLVAQPVRKGGNNHKGHGREAYHHKGDEYLAYFPVWFIHYALSNFTAHFL
jgi:hypothetical protein